MAAMRTPSRIAALAVLAAMAGGVAARAQEADRFRWDRTGQAALAAAAVEAKDPGARLLLGLSGSPT
jgi:hypothetical protein